MFRVILGRAGSGKTTAVLRRLVSAGKERPQVLMVPEQQSHEAERALCQAGGPEVSLYAEVLSFSRLSNRVFQAAGGLGEEELDEGGRLLLMYRAVQSLSSQLKVYARPSRRPAFLQSLLSTVDEVKGACISPEKLMEAGRDNPGPEGDKLFDLGLIFGEYQALTARSALDPRDRLTRVWEKLGSCPWAEGKDLWLDGFTDFTPQQRLVLERLMAQGENMTLTLTCDHLEEDEGEPASFPPPERPPGRCWPWLRSWEYPVKWNTLSHRAGERFPPWSIWSRTSLSSARRSPSRRKGRWSSSTPIPPAARWSGPPGGFWSWSGKRGTASGTLAWPPGTTGPTGTLWSRSFPGTGSPYSPRP